MADQKCSTMTHGRSAGKAGNSRTKSRERCLTGFSKEPKNTFTAAVHDLEIRMTEAEGQIADLIERVDRVAGILPTQYLPNAEANPKKPGPQKNIGDDELFRSRDGIVGWLEGIWPEIVRQLLAATDPRKIQQIFKSVARPKDSRPPWQTRFLRHPARLLDFLNGGKFRRKPPKKTVLDALNLAQEDERRKRAANRLPTRQIANAMAGAPKLSWRTSFDRCSKAPCSYLVTLTTAEYYRQIYDPSYKKP
jgi:hypothetical protein